MAGSVALMRAGQVRQWRYKPYIVDGKPEEVETTINVIYALAK